MHQKLNIFQLNVKLLNISGVIPSENINTSFWKSALFRIFQILSLLLFISMFILQFLAIYHYWGNITMIADSIAFLAVFATVYFGSAYTILFWKNICDVTDSFETSYIFCSELVRSNQKHMKILNDALNRAHIFTKANFISEIIMPLFFTLPSFVQHLMTADVEILQEVETVDGFTKYFIFVIWLPPWLKQEFIIRVIYGLQFIYVWEICFFTATLMPFYTVILFYTGTQFKLISSIIRDMDEVTCRVENPDNIHHAVPEQLFIIDTKKLSGSFELPMSNKLPLKSNFDIEEPTALSNERILNSKMQQSALQEVDINRQSARTHNLSLPEIKSTKHDSENFYLLECIKLHQASIK